MREEYDLIIVGGGLVGTGLALALRQSALRIALIDARSQDAGTDPRLFALNSGSCQFLRNLMLWPRLAQHAAPIREVHVSHQGYFGNTRLKCAEIGLPSLGHVVPACHIETAMNDDSTGFTLYRPAKLTHLALHDGQTELTVTAKEGEIKLLAPLVIGADGTESTVRAQLNIPTEVLDYGQTAIVTMTQLRRSHDHIAYERFVAKGAIAMLPLPGDACATIWTAENLLASELLALSDVDFLQRLQQGFGYRLGRLLAVGKRHSYPLRMVKAAKTSEKSVLLLGNAAHTLHPIAAQGFNLALYEVAALSEAIMDKLDRKEPFTAADLPHLPAQQQRRIGMEVSHHLARAFTRDSLLYNLVLHMGMAGLDMVMPVKRKFIAGIMGRQGMVPRLLLSADGL